MSQRITFSWSTRREGNTGFVLEESSSGHRREFGPMPTHLVLPFVEARRRLVALRAEENHVEYIPEDFSYLTDPKAKLIQN